MGFALVVTGCGGTPESPPQASAATPSSTAPSPTASATLVPIPQPQPAQIPADCGAVGSVQTPPGASLALGCNWIAGDATGYLLLISRADAGAAQTYAESTLPGEGYSCQVGDAPAFICTQTVAGTTYPVDTVETIYVRDGVWIYQSATNTDGEALLTDLVAGIWGT